MKLFTMHQTRLTAVAALVGALGVLPGSAQAARRAVAPTPTPTPAPLVTSTSTSADALSVAPITNEMTQSCEEPATFQAFKAFGDTADYAFAPGGSFENGLTGWSLTGASIVSSNDTSGVYGGSKALRIADGGRVVSPWFCVTPANPHFRYVTYGGEIEMEIDYKVFGESDIDDDLVGETNGGRSWAPSERHELATEIPSHKLAKGVLARIIFEAEDDVYVDNLLVDPYRRG
jgi:hypothetical protein